MWPEKLNSGDGGVRGKPGKFEIPERWGAKRDMKMVLLPSPLQNSGNNVHGKLGITK